MPGQPEHNAAQEEWTTVQHCFFVADRIRAKQLIVEHCPTGDMWADPFTEPLQ
jgi:hypothetical protein